MATVFVTIRVAGVWPTREELRARDAVTDVLTEAGIGSCTGAGGEGGEMDFSFRVTDIEASREAIGTCDESSFAKNEVWHSSIRVDDRNQRDCGHGGRRIKPGGVGWGGVGEGPPGCREDQGALAQGDK